MCFKSKRRNTRINRICERSNKIHEATDVIYHLMVYLEVNNIKIEDVMSELKKDRNDLR